MSIGQNIKKYRKEKGFTQRELADLIGVSVQAISKWETNAGVPDISQVVPLASALDISTDALFDYTCRANPEDFENVKRTTILNRFFEIKAFPIKIMLYFTRILWLILKILRWLLYVSNAWWI